jgi:hypothetical protein
MTLWTEANVFMRTIVVHMCVGLLVSARVVLNSKPQNSWYVYTHAVPFVFGDLLLIHLAAIGLMLKA